MPVLGKEEEQGWVWRVFRWRCRSALGRLGRGGGLPWKTPGLQGSSETGLTRQTGVLETVSQLRKPMPCREGLMQNPTVFNH